MYRLIIRAVKYIRSVGSKTEIVIAKVIPSFVLGYSPVNAQKEKVITKTSKFDNCTVSFFFLANLWLSYSFVCLFVIFFFDKTLFEYCYFSDTADKIEIGERGYYHGKSIIICRWLQKFFFLFTFSRYYKISCCPMLRWVVGGLTPHQ